MSSHGWPSTDDGSETRLPNRLLGLRRPNPKDAKSTRHVAIKTVNVKNSLTHPSSASEKDEELMVALTMAMRGEFELSAPPALLLPDLLDSTRGEPRD